MYQILHGSVPEGGVVRHLQLVSEGGRGRGCFDFFLAEVRRQGGRPVAGWSQRPHERRRQVAQGRRSWRLRVVEPEQAYKEAAAAAPAAPAAAVGVGPRKPRRPRRAAPVARRRARQAEGPEVQALGRGDH